MSLKTISSIFENHEIYQFPELKYQKLKKSKKHPTSEGIFFESLKFAGEIFWYDNGEMKYYEMELLIFKEEKYFVKIVKKPKNNEVKSFISGFLTELYLEIKI